MTITLALDAMGGDEAPTMVIAGADLALKCCSDQLHFRIFGRSEVISGVLASFPKLERCSEIIHTDEVITNHIKPSLALRNGRTSSMGQAVNDVALGKSHAVISAGNTGAYMALSKILLKTFDQIDRPAIPAFIPTLKGKTLVLDLGANIECSPENLVQFAVMGSSYVKQLIHISNPSIGLLNVGSEELKGNAVVQEASRVLKDLKDLNFYGFVEGDHITKGVTDVVVTDGFTGNITLKAIEGTAKLFGQFLKDGINSSWKGKLGYLLAKPVFDNLKHRCDPRLYNGAMFLGLRQIAIKSHGGTDAIGFANAISVAIQLVQQNILQDMENSLAGVT